MACPLLHEQVYQLERIPVKGVNVFTLTRYIPLEEYDAQRRLIGTRYQDHRDNLRVLKDKERKTLYALLFLVAEVVVLAVLWIVAAIFGR